MRRFKSLICKLLRKHKWSRLTYKIKQNYTYKNVSLVTSRHCRRCNRLDSSENGFWREEEVIPFLKRKFGLKIVRNSIKSEKT